jgi:TP901 family phage tail tape measure protein
MARDFKLGFKISADGGDQAAKEVARMEQALKKVREENAQVARTAAALKNSYKLNDSEIRQVIGAMKDLENQTSKTGNVMNSIFQGVGQQLGQNVLAGVQRLATGLPNAAVESFRGFDAAVRQSGVISGASEEQLASLRGEIERLGIVTSKSPEEIGQMSVALSRAGFTATEQVAALEGIARASEATGESVLAVGDIIGKTIRTFGLSADEAGTVGDILTATANNTNSSILTLGESFQYVGPAAAAANQPLGDTAVLLGLLGDQGIQGSMAGTNLAAALERLKIASAGMETEFSGLVRGSARASQAFDAIGVGVRNADGSMKSVLEILPLIQQNMTSLSQQDKDVLMKALFGVEGGRAFQALLNTAPERIALVNDAVQNSAGLAEESSKKLLEGLNGALLLFEGSAQGALAAIGEFLAVGIEPTVRGATLLINTFLGLPGPIQKALIGTAAFTTVLAAAAAALTAYNAANGTKILQDVISSAGTIKNTAAQLANTAATTGAAGARAALVFAYQANIGAMIADSAGQVKNAAVTATNAAVTQASAAAKSVLAAATGQATAAQLAQTAAIAKGTIALGAVAGAAAAVALVADTFNAVTEQAAMADAGTEEVKTALAAMADAGTAAGDAVSESVGTEAAQNFAALRESIGPFQRALDDLIRGPIPGLATATEAASNRSAIAFDELVAQTDDVKLAAAQMAVDLEKGIEIDPAKIEATVAGIDSAINALKAQQPDLEEDIARRDAQMKQLTLYRDRISATTAGVVAMGEATGGLTEKIKELDGALKDTIAGIDLTKLQAQARILEQLARGEITQDQADTQLANVESGNLQERFKAQTEQLNNLRKLRAEAEEGSAQAIELDKKITESETGLAQTRISLARQTVNEQKEAEKEATKAAEKSAKEQQRLTEETAKKRGDDLKAQRDEVKRLAEETFGDGQREEGALFSKSQSANAEAFQKQQQASAKAFQKSQQSDQEAFAKEQDGKAKTFQKSQQSDQEAFAKEQEGKAKAFRKSQQSDQEAFAASQSAEAKAFQQQQQAEAKSFQQQQQAEAKSFQRQLDAERDNGNREFDALGKEVERRLALRQATKEEADALKAQYAEEDRLLKERKKIEAEVLRQRGSVLSSADTDLSPLEKARAEFEERIQAKAAAFQEAQAAEAEAFQAEQQAIAEAFEAAQKEQERAFSEEQEKQAEAFQESQRAADKAFREEQQAAAEAFQESQRAADKAFREEQQAAAEAFQESQRAADKAFREEQQAAAEAFANQQREADRAFKEQQRQLDKQNADQIAAILAAAKPAGATPRKDGGPIRAGQTYLVGEVGPELIVPSRSGYVLTAKETAALERSLNVMAPALSVASPSGNVEGQLNAILRTLQRAAKRPIHAPQNNTFINEPNPAAATAELRLAELRQRIRGGAL